MGIGRLRRRIYRWARQRAVAREILLDQQLRQDIVAPFHKLYYDTDFQTYTNTRWLGLRVLKCPLDLWVYQELIYELRPDVLVETGTCNGGSALFLASICDLLGRGRVVTVDISDKKAAGWSRHPRIMYVLGSSTDESTLAKVRSLIAPAERVMVFLDSDHSKAHVLRELHAYSPLVTKGSYLVVEDTNKNGHPVAPEFGPGPMEAVEEFLRERDDFAIDRTQEKFYMTFNPSGYLRRVR